VTVINGSGEAGSGPDVSSPPALLQEGPATERPRVLRAGQGAPAIGELEMQLIALLQDDGRISFAEMARRTGAAEKTVRRKVGMLLDEAYVQVSAVTDPALLGYAAMALVCITVDGSVPTAELADALAEVPAIDYVTVTTGRFAMQVEVVCADEAEMQRVVDEQIRARPGVRDVEVLAYLRLHYQQARFDGVLLDDATGGVRPRELDEIDQRIVGRLARDGRAPFSDLSAALDVSETMIRQRFQRLVASGAVKVMCIANPLRLGFRSVCWIGMTAQPGARAVDIAEALTELPAVTYVAVTAGRFDVLTEVVCQNQEDLLTVVDGQLRALPGVASVEVWLYLDLRYKPLEPRASGAG
jgi:DNA-binding Lrp family transcriptional regulator